ncbi:tereporin-Ca1-like [Mytilus trossulus]|uniref:tereporin-Ca1-like n=1 Tax=Mytilus trossulus TaxID=6551 RepID=UPI0030056D48
MASSSPYSRHNRFGNRNFIEDSDSDETSYANNCTKLKRMSRATSKPEMTSSVDEKIECGNSLHGTSLSTLMTNKHYSIVVGIEITNMTRYHLIKPKTKTHSGYISTPAVSVRPGYKEAMIAHKHGYTMTGSSGIVSWLIQNKEKRLVVAWRSPYFSNNWVGIGLTTVGSDTHYDSWFKIMRNNQQGQTQLKHKFSTFSDSSEEMMIEDDDFKVICSMGTSSKPEVKITLCPL